MISNPLNKAEEELADVEQLIDQSDEQLDWIQQILSECAEMLRKMGFDVELEGEGYV